MNLFEIKELDYLFQYRETTFKSNMIYICKVGDKKYLSDLYTSYLYWRKVIEIATLQYYTNRYIHTVLDNNLKFSQAISYYISLLKRVDNASTRNNKHTSTI